MTLIGAAFFAFTRTFAATEKYAFVPWVSGCAISTASIAVAGNIVPACGNTGCYPVILRGYQQVKE